MLLESALRHMTACADAIYRQTSRVYTLVDKCVLALCVCVCVCVCVYAGPCVCLVCVCVYSAKAGFSGPAEPHWTGCEVR